MSQVLSRRKTFALIVVGLLVAVLSLGVFPLREYLDQQAAIRETSSQLEEVRTHNAALEERIAALASDDLIEYLARSEYSLVYPDEEAYTILPLPDFDERVPTRWPFSD